MRSFSVRIGLYILIAEQGDRRALAECVWRARFLAVAALDFVSRFRISCMAEMTANEPAEADLASPARRRCECAGRRRFVWRKKCPQAGVPYGAAIQS
jgi:hypothetical protein